MKILSYTLSSGSGVTLTCYLHDKSPEYWGVEKRPAMLVLPGGGYRYCSDREADPVALCYLRAGYQAFVLRYSVGEDIKWPAPMLDYEEAIELIKSSSQEWQVDEDRICVVGFSAGGHLAAACACLSKYRPAACILGYPVITNETDSGYLENAPGIPESVSEKTSPIFVFSSRTDSTVPIDNTIRLLDALTKNNIPYESHIYAYANHGFTTCDSWVQNRSWICTRTPDWVEDSIEWLKDSIGDFNEGKVSSRKNW